MKTLKKYCIKSPTKSCNYCRFNGYVCIQNLLHKKLIIIYIKYPVIKNICDIYYARSISRNDGISYQIVKCENTFYERSNFMNEHFY